MFTMNRSLPVIVALLAGSAYAAEPATSVVPPSGTVTAAPRSVAFGDSVTVASDADTFLLPGGVSVKADPGSVFVLSQGGDGAPVITLQTGALVVDPAAGTTSVLTPRGVTRIHDGKVAVSYVPPVGPTASRLTVYSEGGASFSTQAGSVIDIPAGRKLILAGNDAVTTGTLGRDVLSKLTLGLPTPASVFLPEDTSRALNAEVVRLATVPGAAPSGDAAAAPAATPATPASSTPPATPTPSTPAGTPVAPGPNYSQLGAISPNGEGQLN